jgi:hypothetical protein
VASTIQPYTVTATAATLITYINPGPSSFYISAGPGTAGIYIGLGTATSALNGLYIPSGYPPWEVTRFIGLGARALYGIAASGTVTAAIAILDP